MAVIGRIGGTALEKRTEQEGSEQEFHILPSFAVQRRFGGIERASKTEWDQPPDSTGHEVPKVFEDGGTTIAERLVAKGVDEADRDERIAASDPDYEP